MSPLQQLGQFRIEASLGSSTRAEVYRAYDMVRKRTVTLRTLKAGLLPDPQAYREFLEQAALASDLVHPHIAWVWEADQADNVYYLAERFINGPSLAQFLADSGPLPWEEGIKTIQQVAQGLDFAHAKDWVHGDLKPQDILVSPEHGAVITGFGWVQACRAFLPHVEQPNLSGSPAYAAPEIWLDKPAVAESDQYALACIFIETVTGQAFAHSSTLAETRARHLDAGTLIQADLAGLPVQAISPLQRALAADPEKRFASAGEFANTLAEEVVDQDNLHAENVAWLQVKEKARRDKEESERQAALEQARREIEAQSRQPVPGVLPPQPGQTASTDAPARNISQPPPVLPPAPSSSLPAQSGATRAGMPASASRRQRPRPAVPRRPGWQVWAGVGLFILIFAVLWWGGSAISGFLFPATPTPTSPTIPPSLPSTSTATSVPSQTATPTSTASPSPTITPTWTITDTPTQTPTATLTSKPTRTPTPTRTPKEEGSSNSSRASNPTSKP